MFIAPYIEQRSVAYKFESISELTVEQIRNSHFLLLPLLAVNFEPLIHCTNKKNSFCESASIHGAETRMIPQVVQTPTSLVRALSGKPIGPEQRKRAHVLPTYVRRFPLQNEQAVPFSKTPEGRRLLFLARAKAPGGQRVFEFWRPWDFVNFCKHSPQWRLFYHEMIPPDEKIKFFVDMESETVQTEEQWMAKVELLHKLFVQVAVQRCNGRVITVEDRELWHAHRPGKFSTHVIYDIDMSRNADVKAIATEISNLSDGELPEKLIDFKLYSETAYKQMRLPYSNQFLDYGQNGPVCALFRNAASKSEPFDVNGFIRSFVTMDFRLGQANRITYQILDHTVSSRFYGSKDGFNFMTYLDEPSAERVTEQTSLVKNWLLEKKFAVQLTQEKKTMDSIKWRCEPMYCEVLGRHHCSNGTCVELFFNALGEVDDLTFWCTDCEAAWRPEILAKTLALPDSLNDLFMDAMDEETIQFAKVDANEWDEAPNLTQFSCSEATQFDEYSMPGFEETSAYCCHVKN